MLRKALVSHLLRLRTDASYRMESKTVVVEGARFLRDIVTTTPLRPLRLVLSESDGDDGSLSGPSTCVYRAPSRVLARLSTSITPNARIVLAELPMPPPSDLQTHPRILCLDNVQDPGNVGSLVRAAVGFGFSILSLPGTADLFGDKVVRASAGAVFRLPYATGTAADLEALPSRRLLFAEAAAAAASTPLPQVKLTGEERIVLCLGNEGQGISAALQKLPHASLNVPLHNNLESLNVATAGGILMYALQQKAA